MTQPVKSWRDDRRQAILDVAFKSFLENGYAATSMSQIAANLGGSKTTLYHYFPSKDALFIAVAKAQSMRVVSRLYPISDADGDTRTILETFCIRFMTEILHDDEVEFLRMAIAQAPQFPEIGQAFFHECILQGVEHAEKFIHRMKVEGRLHIENPRLAAHYLLSLCSGVLTLEHLLCPSGARIPAQDVPARAREIVAFFMRGFASDASGTGACVGGSV